MTRSTTNADTGQRAYYIEQATPPRWMRSITSSLQSINKPLLVNAAGKVNRERTADAAHDLAMELIRENREDIGSAFGSFGFDLWKRVEKVAFHNEAWKKKANVGTVVHYAIASWDFFRHDTDFDPLASEEVVWIEGSRYADPLKFDVERMGYPEPAMQYDVAMRLDLAAVVAGRRMILDVKSGSGVYPEHWLQIEGQRMASNLRGLCGGGFVSAGILHVPAAGGPVKLYDQEGTGLTAAEKKKMGLPRNRAADLEALDYACGLSEWMNGRAEG